MTPRAPHAANQPSVPSQRQHFAGRVVVITRPAGHGRALAARVRQLGGTPLLLPGVSLRGAADAASTRAALRLALADELLIFTSPAAVRHAAALIPLLTRASVFAVGGATARGLRRHSLAPCSPARQDSEGLLGLPQLQAVRGRRIALVGAPGGRGLLRAELAARGAEVREVHVYQRVPPRLDRRHFDALVGLPPSALVLLSSAETLDNFMQMLPGDAWTRLQFAQLVVSSQRLQAHAHALGFKRVLKAASALAADLLAAALRSV